MKEEELTEDDRVDRRRETCFETTEDDGSSSEDTTTSSCDADEVRVYEEELERHGMYDFDASKLKRILGYHPVEFEKSLYVDEPDTDGYLITRLSQTALDIYNYDTGKHLEFVRAVKSNWSYGAERIFYTTFEAKDKDAEHIISFHAAVGYSGSDSTIYRVHPKPDYVE